MDYNAAALEMHAKYPGKLTVNSLFEVKDRDALSTATVRPLKVYLYTSSGFALIWRQGSATPGV